MSPAPPPAGHQLDLVYRPFDQTPDDLANIIRLVETELSEPYTVRPSPLKNDAPLTQPQGVLTGLSSLLSSRCIRIGTSIELCEGTKLLDS